MGRIANPETLVLPQTSHTKNALVVTQDTQMGAAVADSLARKDFTVWAASDVSTALALSSEIAFDLAAADVTLTGSLDCIDLALALRKRDANMAVIILVAPEDKFPEGIQDFAAVRKPGAKVGASYDPNRFRYH